MKKMIPALLVAIAASTALADFNTGLQAGPIASDGPNGDASNGLFTFTYTDPTASFNRIRIRGGAENGGTGSYASELRYSILTDSGARASGAVASGSTWTGVLPVDNTQAISAFTLTSGNSYTFRMWESYNDSGTDAFWYDLQFDLSFVDPRPQCTDLGTLASANDINTFGSAFDTELGLYDNNGNRLADNDDAGGGFQSQILTGGLANGTYYVAVGGFNTTFGATEWNVVGGPSNGTYDLTIDGSIVASDTLPANAVHWYCFTIPTPGSAMLLGMGGLVAIRRRR